LTYWDTSALVKLYVSEKDSAYFYTLALRDDDIMLTANITVVEMLTSLYRKESAGELKKGGAAKLFEHFKAQLESGRITLAPYSEEVVLAAESIVRQTYENAKPIMIRALDVIHVASALASKSTVLITTDERLKEVAQLVGLKVLPQN
jgi:predicted nucleic acid-binding protein